MKSGAPDPTAEAGKIAGDFLEQARAAAERGEDLSVLGLARLRAAVALLAMTNPSASAALSHALKQAGATLGLVSKLTRPQAATGRG